MPPDTAPAPLAPHAQLPSEAPRPDSRLTETGATDRVLSYGVAWAIMAFSLVPYALSIPNWNTWMTIWGVLNVLGAIVSLLVLTRRHRDPRGGVLWGAGLMALAPAATGPTIVQFAHLATTARRRVLLACGGAVMAGGALSNLRYLGQVGDPRTPVPQLTGLGATLACLVGAGLVGLLVRYQRRLDASHQLQVRAAWEADQARLEAVRVAERERLAREMHDVVAHRISLVAMHAGALAYRTDLPPETMREVARQIQDNAHHSLQELRGVLGTLRGPDDAPADPQPTLERLAQLVRDAGDVGQQVDLDLGVLDLAAIPTDVGRHAYRIVQEGVTNARKHAPGAPVTVSISGNPPAPSPGAWDARQPDSGRPDSRQPDSGRPRPGESRGSVRVQVANPEPAQAAGPVGGHVPVPGAGLGLVGLEERVHLVGGSLSHGWREGPDGRQFVVAATLPWPA